jgi:hypothetical protein
VESILDTKSKIWQTETQSGFLSPDGLPKEVLQLKQKEPALGAPALLMNCLA